MRREARSDDFLLALETSYRRHYSAAPKISAFLVFISCATSVNFTVLALGNPSVLYISAAILLAAVILHPISVYLRSTPVSRSKRKEIFQALGLDGADRFLIRTRPKGDMMSADCGLLRFICIPESSLSPLSTDLESRNLRCKLTHEFAHLKAHDPFRLSLLTSFAAISAFSLGSLIDAEVSARTNSWGVVRPETQSISYLVLAIFCTLTLYSIYVLFDFVHRRERSADAVAYDLLGEDYKSFTAAQAQRERFTVAKSRITGYWNALTHPRFEERHRDLGQAPTSPIWYPSLVILQAYVIVLAAPLMLFMFDEALNDAIWGSNARDSDTLIAEWWRGFFWVTVVQWAVFAYAFAGEARTIIRAGCTALPILIVSLCALYFFDDWLLGEFFHTLIGSRSADIRQVYESQPLFRFPVVLVVLLIFSAATLITGTQDAKPYGIGWLQNLNRAFFSFRMTFAVFVLLLDTGALTIKFVAITLTTWIAIEITVELLRRGRVIYMQRKFKRKSSNT